MIQEQKNDLDKRKDKDRPLVTAIITTYGRPVAYLDRAVRSVLGQTYEHLELIVVDDNGLGSDRQKANAAYMEQVIRETARPVRYLPNHVNRGAQVSRNRGLGQGRGAFFAFLDDDDEWLPKKTEKQLKMFTDESIGLVYCNGRRYEEQPDGHVRVKENYNWNSFKPQVTLADMFYFNYIGSTSQAMIRRRTFEDCGVFDTEQPAAQDYEMWIRIIRKYRCVGIADSLFIYHDHPYVHLGYDQRNCAVGFERMWKKHGKEGCYITRWKLLARIADSNRMIGNRKKWLFYGLCSLSVFLKGYVVDRKEWEYRTGAQNIFSFAVRSFKRRVGGHFSL